MVNVRYDKVGANAFPYLSVTGKSGNASGIIHDIIQDFPVDPRIIAAIPFHLCDARGPMYYIPNTMYHLKNGDLQLAKRTAIISSDPNDSLYLSDDDVLSLNEEKLNARLPELLRRFNIVLDTFGFPHT